jgi:tripartite-type tricarboxylate transporter receptor subunit TctC
MISGRVQMMHISLNPTIAHIRAGTLRPLVVTAKERWTEYLPDVPTSTEAGLPDYEMDIWFGLVAPRGTPKPIIDRLNGYVRAMSADSLLRKRIIDGFLRPVDINADEFGAYVERDVPRWEKIIRESGVVAE